MSKLTFIKGETNENGGSVELIGGVTGSGKTIHVIEKTAEALKNNESVLIFSDEVNPQYVVERLASTLAPEGYKEHEIGHELPKDLDEAINLILSADLTIRYGVEDEETIINEIKEKSASEEGLDLVVIDSFRLKTSMKPSNDKEENAKQALEQVGKFNDNLKCKVLITTQLNREFASVQG